jgi:NAD(P)-dependent dehydrogenase (short-subunit alcohol dehydrogenase family)
MARQVWNSDNIADLTGKSIIVTGANTGLGKETTRVLAQKGADIVLAVRDEQKGDAAVIDILRDAPDAKLTVMRLDLSDLSSIRDFASAYSKWHATLDILINNAGVMVPPYSKTTDGFELQFGTNHLGHFALTGLLFPILNSTAGSRIVTVSSIAHRQGNLNFDDLAWEDRDYKPGLAYGDSKIANLYFTYELARKTEGKDITVTAAHPGWTATDLQRYSGLFSFFNPIFAQKPVMGALPTLRAATDPGVESGDYYGPSGFGEIKGYPVKVNSNTLSKNREIASRLWKSSEQLTGVLFP